MTHTISELRRVRTPVAKLNLSLEHTIYGVNAALFHGNTMVAFRASSPPVTVRFVGDEDGDWTLWVDGASFAVHASAANAVRAFVDGLSAKVAA